MTIEEMARQAGIWAVPDVRYVRRQERERAMQAILEPLKGQGAKAPSSDFEIILRRAAERVRLMEPQNGAQYNPL